MAMLNNQRVLQKLMVFNGTSCIEIDDKMGYPHAMHWKPPYVSERLKPAIRSKQKLFPRTSKTNNEETDEEKYAWLN